MKPNPASPASYANTLPLNYQDLFFSNNQKFGHQIKVLMSYIWERNWCTPIFFSFLKEKKKREKKKRKEWKYIKWFFFLSIWICPDEFVMIAYNIMAVLCSKSDRKGSDCTGFFNYTTCNRQNRHQTILDFWSHNSQQTKHTSTILDFWSHNSQETKHTSNHTGFLITQLKTVKTRI